MNRYAVVALLLAAPALAGDVPDPRLTPGAVTDLNVVQVCTRKWGKDARHVTAAMKRDVLAAYASTKCKPNGRRTVEIDHLISRELGGADSTANLWKQCYLGRWNAAMKDRLENRLHAEICADRLDLAAAQEMIRTDWRIPYRKYFGEPK